LSAADPQLLARLRRGDEAAYTQIVREHYAELVVAAERLLADRAAAEDVVQEVMLELWRRRKSIADTPPIRGYLYRAVRNQAFNQLRHLRVVRRAEPDLPLPTAAPPTDAQVSTAELDAAVREALRELPSDIRETFQMSRADGLTYAEIAQTLGVSVKAVEARMGKALRLLREQLAPWLPRGGGW
jgi:RNA polymerase sigma-70 factor (ECF subfamily)